MLLVFVRGGREEDCADHDRARHHRHRKLRTFFLICFCFLCLLLWLLLASAAFTHPRFSGQLAVLPVAACLPRGFPFSLCASPSGHFGRPCPFAAMHACAVQVRSHQQLSACRWTSALCLRRRVASSSHANRKRLAWVDFPFVAMFRAVRVGRVRAAMRSPALAEPAEQLLRLCQRGGWLGAPDGRGGAFKRGSVRPRNFWPKRVKLDHLLNGPRGGPIVQFPETSSKNQIY